MTGEMVRQFDRIRSGVLARPRDIMKLSKEVLEMRAAHACRTRQVETRSSLISNSAGAVSSTSNLWFNGACCCGLTRTRICSDLRIICRLLEAFSAAGLLPKDEIRELSEAYCSLRRRINHLALQEEPGLAGADDFVAEREAVMRIWSRLLEYD